MPPIPRQKLIFCTRISLGVALMLGFGCGTSNGARKSGQTTSSEIILEQKVQTLNQKIEELEASIQILQTQQTVPATEYEDMHELGEELAWEGPEATTTFVDNYGVPTAATTGGNSNLRVVKLTPPKSTWPQYTSPRTRSSSRGGVATTANDSTGMNSLPPGSFIVVEEEGVTNTFISANPGMETVFMDEGVSDNGSDTYQMNASRMNANMSPAGALMTDSANLATRVGPVAVLDDDVAWEGPVATTVNETELFQIGHRLFREQQYDEAEEGFRKFLRYFPDSARAEDAHYWIGESLYAKQNYKTALQQFATLVMAFPNGTKAPEALYRMAMCYNEQDRGSEAVAALRQLEDLYPYSTAAQNAQELLQTLE